VAGPGADPAADAALAAAAASEVRRTIASLFESEPNRVAACTRTAVGLTFDFSKQRVSEAALKALITFAAARDVAAHRDAMVAGATVNITENRAALHTALRGIGGDSAVEAAVRDARTQAKAFYTAFHADRRMGGLEPVEAILHLGTGGSDLGPRLVYDALKAARRDDLTVRFAANIDAAEMADALEGLNPKRTMVCIVSKTFTTLETMANAAVARAWLEAALGPDGADARVVAITASPEAARAAGVGEDRIFPFWDWVGGRYSVWSAVGLSVELALQPGAWDAFLDGAAAMDRHALTAGPQDNLPLLAALVAHWNRTQAAAAATATVCYAHRLSLLAPWLQQLEMESNGKSVDAAGQRLAIASAGVTWGGVGATVQHSFFQLLHQGRTEIPVDFVVVQEPMGEPTNHHRSLLANALAQAQALLQGKSLAVVRAELAAKGLPAADIDALAPHKVFPGDRPSSILALDELSPHRLGALLAFYEHRTTLQAWLAGVNPFDQWGVELGKEMATKLSGALAHGAADPPGLDPSTSAWLGRLKS
jgi:glucose-6-phosphate isomerase